MFNAYEVIWIKKISFLPSQPKGADRKHKTDREKLEKRSESEKVILKITCYS